MISKIKIVLILITAVLATSCLPRYAGIPKSTPPEQAVTIDAQSMIISFITIDGKSFQSPKGDYAIPFYVKPGEITVGVRVTFNNQTAVNPEEIVIGKANAGDKFAICKTDVKRVGGISIGAVISWKTVLVKGDRDNCPS